jgi:hypothetical protein
MVLVVLPEFDVLNVLQFCYVIFLFAQELGKSFQANKLNS